MAESTLHFDWRVKLKLGFELYFEDRDDVFVAGNLSWYPEESDTNIRVTPDVMVVFGRPQENREEYRQWSENDTVPQVVFEIFSLDKEKENEQSKLDVYEKYGVEEYYQYDPEKTHLRGWVRMNGTLSTINPIKSWISPRLKLQFQANGEELKVYDTDGGKILSYSEQHQDKKSAEEKSDKASHEAEQAKKEKEMAYLGMEEAKAKAKFVESQLEQVEIKVEFEKLRVDRLKNKLVELNINPDTII